MAFLHELSKGAPIEVGAYTVALVDTSPGPDPDITLEVDGPAGDVVEVELDPTDWYLPEVHECSPNTPQHRTSPEHIYVGLSRGDGKVGHTSAELVIKAPSEIPITIEDGADRS